MKKKKLFLNKLSFSKATISSLNQLNTTGGATISLPPACSAMEHCRTGDCPQLTGMVEGSCGEPDSRYCNETKMLCPSINVCPAGPL